MGITWKSFFPIESRPPRLFNHLSFVSPLIYTCLSTSISCNFGRGHSFLVNWSSNLFLHLRKVLITILTVGGPVFAAFVITMGVSHFTRRIYVLLLERFIYQIRCSKYCFTFMYTLSWLLNIFKITGSLSVKGCITSYLITKCSQFYPDHYTVQSRDWKTSEEHYVIMFICIVLLWILYKIIWRLPFTEVNLAAIWILLYKLYMANLCSDHSPLYSIVLFTLL